LASFAAQKSGWTPLHLAAKERHSLCVGVLLSNSRCNVDAIDRQGRTALHFAAMNNDMYAVKELVRHGADSTMMNRKKKTPADIAMASGHNMLANLLAMGA
jgi:ankyrin repeat protein